MAELSATKSSADLLADVDLGSSEEAERAESVEDAGAGSSSGSRRRRSPELTPRPAEKEDEVVVEDGEPDVELTPGDAIELDGVDGQGDDASASMQAGPSNEGKRVKVCCYTQSTTCADTALFVWILLSSRPLFDSPIATHRCTSSAMHRGTIGEPDTARECTTIRRIWPC